MPYSSGPAHTSLRIAHQSMFQPPQETLVPTHAEVCVKQQNGRFSVASERAGRQGPFYPPGCDDALTTYIVVEYLGT